MSPVSLHRIDIRADYKLYPPAISNADSLCFHSNNIYILSKANFPISPGWLVNCHRSSYGYRCPQVCFTYVVFLVVFLVLPRMMLILDLFLSVVCYAEYTKCKVKKPSSFKMISFLYTSTHSL